MEVGLEALLPLRELQDDFYHFDRERLSFVGQNTGRVLGVGTEMPVQVVSVDIAPGRSNHWPQWQLYTRQAQTKKEAPKVLQKHCNLHGQTCVIGV